MAQRYCKNRYDPEDEHSKDVYLSLLRVYLSPPRGFSFFFFLKIREKEREKEKERERERERERREKREINKNEQIERSC